MGDFGLNEAQIAGMQNGYILSDLMHAAAAEYKKHLEEVMMVRQCRCIAVMFKNMDPVPLIHGKVPVLQVFRRDRFDSFRNQQMLPIHTVFIQPGKIFIKTGGGSFGKTVIPIKDLAVIQGMKHIKQLFFVHLTPLLPTDPMINFSQ